MNTERQPLYMQIQRHFKDLIAQGQLKGGDKIPSEKELMEQFDVSRITVANALVQLAKEGWIYRIPGRGSFVSADIETLLAGQPDAGDREQREQHGYKLRATGPRPDTGDREQESGSWLQNAAGGGGSGSGSEPRARMIGLLMPDLADHFALRLVQGVNSVLERGDCELHIIVTGNSIRREKEAIRNMIRMGADGLLIFPCDAETYNEEILSLKAAGYPFVLIDRYLPGIETNVVRSDGQVGGRMAVDYLWELGHRDIAICSDSILPTITVEDRINGYMEGLKRRGALINPALILTDFNVDYHRSDEDHPLYRFVKNRMATAYMTLNGRLGVHISSICRQLGLRVPEDVSILTFDDPASGLGEEGAYSHISQSEGKMGEQAARMLLGLLEGGRQEEPGAGGYGKIIMEPQLVVRQSTGPHRS